MKMNPYIYALGAVIVVLVLCYMASVWRGPDSFEVDEQPVEEKVEENKPEEKKVEEKKPEVTTTKVPEDKLNESQTLAIQNLKPTLSMCNAFYGPAPA